MPSPRLAALLLAAPLAFAPAAYAEPIIDGCWGAASATYCDPELRITPLRGDPSPTPICAGTCTYVGVPTVEPAQDRYEVCLDYTTPQGYSGSECVVDVQPADLAEIVAAVRERLGCDPKCGGGGLTLAEVVAAAREAVDQAVCNMTC
ncbi:MAG TPA: hypothetical protein VGX28_04795 [Frankiaceae bacterium]|jgi:hypothetical protein|nr:hypothetical protein [Frankiaceae bacterium]